MGLSQHVDLCVHCRWSNKTLVEDTEVYAFIEHHPTGGDAIVRVTAKQIIRFMREQHPDKYTDQELLDSFLVIHWAHPLNPEKD